MKREELERIEVLNAARTQELVLAAAVEYIPGLTDKPMMGIGLLCADGKPTTKLIAITGEIGAEWEAQSVADAYYLEAAWNGVPALLRHIAEQGAKIERLRELLRPFAEVWERKLDRAMAAVDPDVEIGLMVHVSAWEAARAALKEAPDAH
jgi:hypothetical protein